MRSALLLACACALALLGAARAQAPVATAFLDRLMDGKQQLTAEQAESVQGRKLRVRRWPLPLWARLQPRPVP